MSIWDDPDLKPSNDFIKFEQPGDMVVGRVTSIRKHTFADGKVCPQIVLGTADGERTMTVGQQQLLALLAAAKPNIGDVISVTFSRIERRAGGKTLKHFDVKVNGEQVGGTDTTAVAAPTQTTTAPGGVSEFGF
jgi:hypothetical protein